MCKALGVVAVGIVIVSAITECTPVSAQNLDVNLLSRVETFIPEPQPTAVPKQKVTVPVTREVSETETVQEQIDRPLSELEQEAEEKGFAVTSFAGMSDADKRAYFKSVGIKTTETITRRRVVKRTVTEKKEIELPAKIQVLLSGTAAYNWQSNATQSPTDIVADSIANNYAALTLIVPVGAKDDSVTTSFGPKAVRYATLDTASFDALVASSIYSHPLPKRYLSAYRTNGTATQDFLSFAVQGLSFYEPGFGSNSLRVISPIATWKRSNIPVSSKICGAPGKEAYCYFADVELDLSKSWTSISSQDNANATLAVAFGWRTPVKGLTLAAGGSVVGRHYTNFKGGREDLVFVPIVKGSWSPHPKVTLSAGTTYTDQTSSQPLAEWSGFNLFPQATLNVKF